VFYPTGYVKKMGLPKLNQILLNGASRHRLRKGFILFEDRAESLRPGFQPQIATGGEEVAASCNEYFAAQPELRGFRVETNSQQPALLELITPLLPVYDATTRTIFMQRLAQAIAHLLRQAYLNGCRAVAAGVNPYTSETHNRPPILCADTHEVEVYNSDELERIYNLYRQFLPELVAISANAAIYGNKIQAAHSWRMKLNPISFLPRYIDQFDMEHLGRLERMFRKEHGLADLKKMDVNPLGGDFLSLTQRERPFLQANTSTIELRFVDAQCCLPFIRAQLILLQAIAVYGRTLARRGNRIFPLSDEILDENKAVAIRSGTTALLKSDPRFSQKDSRQRHNFWFHSHGTCQSASHSLLEIIEGLLLTALQDLNCSAAELSPIVLGAELRRRGHKAFTNYAEYQVYVYYNSGRCTYPRLQEQMERMLPSPTLDPATTYNRQTFAAQSKEIELAWQQKLCRQQGWIRYYEKGRSVVYTADQSEYSFNRYQIEGRSALPAETAVTFTLVGQDGHWQAQAIRPNLIVQQFGRINHYEPGYLYGTITTRASETVYFLRADFVADSMPVIGEAITFEMDGTLGSDLWARRIRRVKPVRFLGRVRGFDKKTGQGEIVQPDGATVLVQRADLVDCDVLADEQLVTFEIDISQSELRATQVRPQAENLNHV
jgi:hypothetical protein